jgi:hypothetical protein
MLIISGTACLIVGFILGYGARASISRHRHKAARRRYDVSGSHRYIEPLAEHHRSGSTSLERTILHEKIPPNDSAATKIDRHDAAHIEADAGNNVHSDALLRLYKDLAAASEFGQKKGNGPHAAQINGEPPKQDKPAVVLKMSRNQPRLSAVEAERLAERLRTRIGLNR